MLKAPALTQIDDFTIYGDDTYFFRFFPLATNPGLRVDEDGEPVILLLKYELSDQDRQRNPQLPQGGGYLSFDTSYGATEEQLAGLRVALQPRVDAEWQRLSNGTEAERALPGVAGTTAPPQVELGTPTYTSGKVKIDTPRSTALIAGRVAEGEPSLLDGNTGVFSLDLTTAGATMLEQALAGESDDPADLTPIQVVYDLGFWARLPDVRIHVHADSKKVHDYLRKQLEGQGVDYCTTYEFDHTDIETETVTMSGAVDVQIDTGSASVPEDVLTELRRFALDLVKEMIGDKFFEDVPETKPANGSTPAQAPGGTHKRLRQQHDEASMTIDLDLTQRSVVEWKVRPQSTLQSYLGELTEEQRGRHVRTLDLTDPFFADLEVTVQVFADFTDLAFVEVALEHGDKTQTLTFGANDARAAKQWRVGRVAPDYRFRHRVAFQGRAPEPWSEWTRLASPGLNLSIPDPGKVQVRVVAEDVDFEEDIESVQVTLAYEDAELGVAREEQGVTLTGGKRDELYERSIGAPVRRPVLYKTRFRHRTGRVTESGTWQPSSGPQLRVNDPAVDTLRVNLVPTGNGWDDVVQVVVDLRQPGGGEQASIPLKTREEFKTWRLPLAAGQSRAFEYRTNAIFKTRRPQRSAWTTPPDGMETVPIVVERTGYRITILPDGLDLAASPITEVTLTFKGVTPQQQATFVFRDKTPQTWDLDVPTDTPFKLFSQVTHSPPGRDPVPLPAMEEDTPFVVLQPYRPRANGRRLRVVASLVDFLATPLVALELAYTAPSRPSQTTALTFDKAATEEWWIEGANGDGAVTASATYFGPDGIPSAPRALTPVGDVLVVPRFKPTPA
jgi:hypothetical protein